MQGRYVSVLRHRGKLFAIDSICYHAGGPVVRPLSPQQWHLVSLATPRWHLPAGPAVLEQANALTLAHATAFHRHALGQHLLCEPGSFRQVSTCAFGKTVHSTQGGSAWFHFRHTTGSQKTWSSILRYPSTAKVWQTLNIGKSPRIPNNLIISGAVHGQISEHCLGVVCQTLPVLR